LKQWLEAQQKEDQYKEEAVKLDSEQVERQRRRQELHRAIYETDLLFL